MSMHGCAAIKQACISEVQIGSSPQHEAHSALNLGIWIKSLDMRHCHCGSHNMLEQGLR